MSLRRCQIALIALVVLLGQWLSVAHAADHPVLAGADVVCDYCVSGIGSGPAPAPELAGALASSRIEPPVAAAPSFVARRLTGPRLSQGPPVIS